jgi:hypothetical protein
MVRHNTSGEDADPARRWLPAVAPVGSAPSTTLAARSARKENRR